MVERDAACFCEEEPIVRNQYVYGEEAKVTSRLPEIEMHAYATGEDFERSSVGIVECHGRIKNPVSVRVYLVREGISYSGGEEGRDEGTVPVGKNDVLLIPKGTDYEERRRLLPHAPAHRQDSDVRYGDLWE